MLIVSIIKLVIGFVLLVKGADLFVDGSSSVAKKFHIPSVVIGLTIVAFGTSAPELAVSMSAALKGSNDIAIGNVVGSNIFNTLVVLGASAAITPIAVEKGIIKKDYPLSIFAAALLAILSLDSILPLYGKALNPSLVSLRASSKVRFVLETYTMVGQFFCATKDRSALYFSSSVSLCKTV